VFLAAFRRVAEGSLDATTRKGAASAGIDRQARAEMEIYLTMPGERGWWRLAYDASGGGLAGLAIPSANEGGLVVGYLGVVPESRGRGYVDDLLASITGWHAAAGAQRITADTDCANLPMAAAFDRAGYVNHGIRLVLSSPG
jgi:RimJ/RimL family protein N-acetyltransferase